MVMHRSGLRWVTIVVLALAVVETTAAPAQTIAAGRSSAAEVLRKVQPEVTIASATAYARGGFARFDAIQASLDALPADGAQLSYWRGYWTGYIAYERGLALLRTGDRKAAQAQMARAIGTLEAIRPADREVNALLALSLGLNLAFVPPDQLMAQVGRSSAVLDRAKAGAPALRPLYVAAVADWNTPAAYGGRRQAEGLLRQALLLPVAKGEGLQPSWGREAAMAQLVRILRETNRTAEANTLLAEALTAYPDSVYIREIGAR